MNTSNDNVVSFPSRATVAQPIDYTAAKQGTTHWNVPTVDTASIGLPLMQQLENKGFIYGVDMRDNLVQNDQGEIVSTGKRTMFNTTSQIAIGVNSTSYKMAQQIDIAAAAVREINNAGIDCNNAFVRVRVDGDGARARAEFVFPETSFDVAVGDTVALCITATNSFDGSGSFQLSFGAFRFICANGMVSPSGIIKYRCAHNSKLDVGFAAKQITAGMVQYNEDKESLQLQAKTRVEMQTVYEALAMMNGIDLSKAATYEQYTAEIRPTLKRQPAIERHMALWNKYKGELGHTQWALNNVLTHISTHGDKEAYSSSQAITTRANKEVLVCQALNHMLAA